MDNTPQLIEQLKNLNKDKRYEACEELRVTSSIPVEALHALVDATRDPDRDVADAARRALAIHLQPETIQQEPLSDGLTGTTYERQPQAVAGTDKISRLIEELKSPNKNKRYYACEELRVSLELPQEALDALKQTTRDPDGDVADAARRALAIHLQPEPLLHIQRPGTAEQKLHSNGQSGTADIRQPQAVAGTDKISRLIEELKSPNKNKRYYACEELRVSLELPQEALDALKQTTRDPDRDVAEAARNALSTHRQPEPLHRIEKEETVEEKSDSKSNWGVIIIVLLILIALIGCLSWAGVFGTASFSPQGSFPTAPPAVVQSGPCDFPGLTPEERANCGTHTYLVACMIIECTGFGGCGCGPVPEDTNPFQLSWTFSFSGPNTMSSKNVEALRFEVVEFHRTGPNTWIYTVTDERANGEVITITFSQSGARVVRTITANAGGLPGKMTATFDATLVQ